MTTENAVEQLRAWQSAGYIRSEQETADWLKSVGINDLEIERILTAFDLGALCRRWFKSVGINDLEIERILTDFGF